MKTASWELCVSWRGGEGMQGRLCRDDARLGVGREGSWLLIYRYWEAMAVAEEGVSCVLRRED